MRSSSAGDLNAALDAVRRPLPEASTLPPRCYVDPDFYALEVERVLSREWLCVARADQLRNPGDFVCADLIGEPIVAVCGADRKIRVLSRVCRHRGMPVVSGSGNCQRFECPYHNWTYALDGKLAGAPEMHKTADFDRAASGLPEFRSETWEGWVFVNFDREAAALAPQLEPLRRVIEPYGFSNFRSAAAIEWDSPWNWKVMVDNFMESYHHMGIHRDSLQRFYPAKGTYADDNGGGPFAILRNPNKGGEPLSPILPMVPGLPDELAQQLLVAAVFPTHLFAATAETLVWYRIEPRSADSLKLTTSLCVLPQALEDPAYASAVEATREVLRAIHVQDIAACEGVQAGYRSRFARSGRYSHLEKALWQFHNWLLDRIGE
jgi:phenylpropionate dioxygenase-like ring-hydroxylating dioxygenase large terminal subunit